MQPLRTHFRAATSLTLGTVALAIAVPAVAQDDNLPPLPQLPPVSGPITQAEISTLPPEYRSLPVVEEATTSIGPDGVETVTRTRRITTSAPVQQSYTPNSQYPGSPYQPVHSTRAYAPAGYPAPAYAPVVFEREEWLDECNRRTNGRDEREKGGIIGGLLGAIGGGIIGNRVADGERLGGTLIGAGVGGLAGLVLGNLIGGGKKNDRYDCEAALDGYLTQYGTHGPRYASRTIAYPAYGYDYAPAQVYYAQPQQMVMVPVQYQQQQRVIVRETVREEVVPGAVRYIPPAPQPVYRPAPSPKLIKNR